MDNLSREDPGLVSKDPMADSDVVELAEGKRYLGIRRELEHIVQEARAALNLVACTITVVDLKRNVLVQVAGDSRDSEFVLSMARRYVEYAPGKQHDEIWAEHFSHDNLIEAEELQDNGGGIIKRWLARKYGIHRALCLPIIRGHSLIGRMNCFVGESKLFDSFAFQLLQSYANQARLILERFRQERLLSRLNEQYRRLISSNPQDFMSQLVVQACELLDVSVCVVWLFSHGERTLRVAAATDQVKPAYRELALHADTEHIKRFFAEGRVLFVPRIEESKGEIVHRAVMKEHGWNSWFTGPLVFNGSILGAIDLFTQGEWLLSGWERQVFQSLVNYSASYLWNLQNLERRQKLDQAVKNLAKCKSVEEAKESLLEAIFKLAHTTRAAVGLFDPEQSQVVLTTREKDDIFIQTLKPGEGIIGTALRDFQSQLVPDVSKRKDFHRHFSDTRSEITVPILLAEATITDGISDSRPLRAIGALNAESAHLSAFTYDQLEDLELLAAQATGVLERLLEEEVWMRVHDYETKLAESQDREQLYATLLEGIQKAFGYSYVNIALVTRDRSRIQSKYVAGIDETKKAQFYELVDHDLLSEDILAIVARTMENAFPGPNDPKVDSAISKEFGLDKLFRVIIPIKDPISLDQALGTVSAGYSRRLRDHILERDVQLLTKFVDYAMRVFAQKNIHLLDNLTHEFRSPITGIRNHALYFQSRTHRIDSVRKDLLVNKLADIDFFCDALYNLVDTFEHAMGLPQLPYDYKSTNIYKEIIQKVVKQFETTARHDRLDPAIYSDQVLPNISLYVDPIRLTQVFTNLLANAIKYRRHKLEVAIHLESLSSEHVHSYLVKDWGIGVSSGNEERIFQRGFRTPEALRKGVLGSGLGLSIAREIMRKHDGDINLLQRADPTIFEITLPRSLRDKPPGGK